MRTLMRAVRPCLIAAVLCAAASSIAVAQTQDDFFADASLQEVRLVVSARDWQTLRANPESNDYYRADLKWKNVTVRNVGIRSRGNGTRNGIKPGLKVDVNRYISNQQFLGLKGFVLDNNYTDSTTIRESVTMKLFARMNIPAPREAHARLFINNEYAGVYTIVEAIDRTFISRLFGAAEANVEKGGYLFEYKYVIPYDFSFLGPDLEAYVPMFEPQTRDTDSMAALYQPIEDLVRIVNETPDRDFLSAVGQYLDLPLLMRQLAVETFMVDWDGLVGNWEMNNFYLYRFRDSTRAQLIPWDKDQTFLFTDMPITFRFDTNVLARRAMDVPELRTAYFDALRECARFATEPGSEDDPRGWLEREIDRQAGLVAGAVSTDPLFPFPVDQFQVDVEGLEQFARVRAPFVGCEVSNATERIDDPQPCTVNP